MARTVTIDGPAGVGKTTLAKRLAEHLDIGYMDTGAMYRGVAWYAGEGAWDWEEDRLLDVLSGLEFSLRGSGRNTVMYLNGSPLDDRIRTEEVGMRASNMARLPVVREFLKKAQKRLGEKVALVAEGRDMGTVVFPQAEHKFFLDASPRVRAQRRLIQLQEMGQKDDFHTILETIQKRDQQDRSRKTAPLRPAEDAHVIDTGNKDIDDVFSEMLACIRIDSRPD